MKKLSLILFLLACSCSAFPTENLALLPEKFAGWQKGPGAGNSVDPAIADRADPGLMKEYGFNALESATYERNGRKIALKAARFADASGAYGAFTTYRQRNMQPEKIGDQAASAGNHILFRRYNFLVDVVLDKVTAMSATDLRELADSLPRPGPDAIKLPTLQQYLPAQSYIQNSEKFIMGPIALEKAHAPLRFALVDFSKGTEVALADYSTYIGTATVMIISYPTPQIAAAHLGTIEDWLNRMRAPKIPSQPGSPVILTGEFQVKRTGPLLAVVAGQVTSRDARSLLASVNYDADVTWHEAGPPGTPPNVGRFLIALFTLIAVIIFCTLVAGVAFGGIRILAKKFFPDRIFDRPEDVDFIQLNLRD